MRKPRVDKVCVICGSEFSVVSSRAKSAKTCGLECRGKLIAKNYKEAKVELTCKACGDSFLVPRCHASRRVYCSMSCADPHRGDHVGTGEDCYNWKGGRVNHSAGYIYQRAVDHPYQSGGYVFEHRLVLERSLREESPGHEFLVKYGDTEYLRNDIQVHHIDEDKKNNLLSNLLACTPSAHRTIHNGKKPMASQVWPAVEDAAPEEPYIMERNCNHCGKQFTAKRSAVKRGGGKYCTRSCYLDYHTSSAVLS